MPLNDVECRNAKPRSKPYKLFDGEGLYLLVTPRGGKLWRLKYRFAGKEKLLAFGLYPDVGLKDARTRRHDARKILANGSDPAAIKKEVKRESALRQKNTFAAVAEAWHEQSLSKWRPATAKKARLYLDLDLIPSLGERPLAEIRRTELVEAIKKIEERKAFNVAKKCRGWLSNIFRYAMAYGIAEVNQASDLNVVAATAPKTKPYPHVTQSELRAFLKKLDSYKGSPQMNRAISLLMLTGFRPGELRHSTWDEIDFEKAVWNKTAEDMKMKRAHIVPLSAQAVVILREMKAYSGGIGLVFASQRKPHQPISDGTINGALGRIGYKGRQTGHGFRHVVSNALNERGYNKDWIERQLSHGDDDEIRATYNKAEYLDQRRQMMQDWADYLDSLRNDSNVIVGNFGKAA